MSKIVSAVGIIALIVVGFQSVSLAQQKATPQQVIQTVKKAVNVLEKSGGKDLSPFDNPHGPWVYKDTYVVLQNCKNGTIAAHPLVPKLVGMKAVGLQDVKGNMFFVQACQAGNKPNGGWIQYWFPKPHAKKPSRKLSYCLHVPNTPLVAIAGIYSNKLTVAQLDKMVQK